jgi:putative colanic acid biosynthesis acetyltransferase WcaF
VEDVTIPASGFVGDATAHTPPEEQASGGAAVDLSAFDNSWYRPGGRARRAVWYACNTLFFKSSIPYPSVFKVALLKLFGGVAGRGVTIKPNVNIKFPWFLEIGDNVWLGEGAWIDNLADVKIGSNVCVSQGAYLLTGNHDYKKVGFDLIVSPIVIEDGAWVGAKAIVCPGSTLRTHAVLTAGSVISGDTRPWTIYSGNAAVPVRKRSVTRGGETAAAKAGTNAPR